MRYHVHTFYQTVLGITLACAPFGCQQYHAKPITAETVDQELLPPDRQAMRVRVKSLHHPLLPPLTFDGSEGITPEQAAVLAVVLNPSLRAERDARGIAQAELIQAGLLPNPRLSAGVDVPYDSPPGSHFTAYNIGLDWDVTALITLDARKAAAASQSASVDLDVLWKEWQIAQAARTAVYDVVALRAQLAKAQEVDHRLAENAATIRHAVAEHRDTVLNLAAVEAASQEAHAVMLETQKDLRHQQFTLNRSLGLGPDVDVPLQPEIALPSRLDLPDADTLRQGLEHSRLDLVALRKGYESQESTVRAAILAQFPKINLGLNDARDTSNSNTIGLGIGLDLPIFDRNQGAIATERATRQKLFDEYVNRVFEARSDLAMALADIGSLTEQIAAAEAAVPSLQRLVDTYKTSMEHGNLDILSYYTALNSLSQKQIDLLKLKQQLAESRIALELAAGRYLPDAIVPSSQPTTDVSR